MPVFILFGSLIASFFPFLHYPWAICCSVNAIWIRSIKLTLLRTYDPWPHTLMNICKMVANLKVFNRYTWVEYCKITSIVSSVNYNVTGKWTSLLLRKSGDCSWSPKKPFLIQSRSCSFCWWIMPLEDLPIACLKRNSFYVQVRNYGSLNYGDVKSQPLNNIWLSQM